MGDLTDVTAMGDSTLSELLRGIAIQSDLTTRLSVNGAALTFAAGTSGYGSPTAPFTIALSGHVRTITASQTITASGAAGTRYLVADIIGAGPGFVLSLPTASQTSATALTLAALWFDGTLLYQSAPLAPVDYGPAFNIGGLAVSLPVITGTSSGTASIGAGVGWAAPSSLGTGLYFTIATPTRVCASYTASLSTTVPNPGAGNYAGMRLIIANATADFPLAEDYTGQTHGLVVLMPAGTWQFQVQWTTAGTNTAATLWYCQATLELTRGT